MNSEKVVEELKKQYPDKKIILNHKDNPSEIVCEIDPSKDHYGFSSLVYVIDQTEAHYHKEAAEIYYVLKGKLDLVIEGVRFSLEKDQYKVIAPGKIHMAKGKETWVLVYSEPGWQKEDHLEVKDKPLSFIPSLTHVRLYSDKFKEMFEFYEKGLDLPLKFGKIDSDFAEFEAGDGQIMIYKKELMPDFIKSKGGINQAMSLSLKVEDAKIARAYLEAKKLLFLTPITKDKKTKIQFFYLKDPDDNILEIYSILE